MSLFLLGIVILVAGRVRPQQVIDSVGFGSEIGAVRVLSVKLLNAAFQGKMGELGSVCVRYGYSRTSIEPGFWDPGRASPFDIN